MQCPECKDSMLELVLTKQGVEVDYCQKCNGVWLNRGEIYLLARRPEIVSRRLKEVDKILKKQIPSPKTNTVMTPVNYPEGTEIYICDSGGIWIDGRHINKCSASDDNIIIDLDLLSPNKAGAYQEQEIVDREGERRSPIPYVELQDIPNSGRIQNRWVPVMKKIGAIVFICIGLLCALCLLGQA